MMVIDDQDGVLRCRPDAGAGDGCSQYHRTNAVRLTLSFQASRFSSFKRSKSATAASAARNCSCSARHSASSLQVDYRLYVQRQTMVVGHGPVARRYCRRHSPNRQPLTPHLCLWSSVESKRSFASASASPIACWRASSSMALSASAVVSAETYLRQDVVQ